MPFITTSVGGDGPGLPGPQGEPGQDATTGDITFDGVQIIGDGTASGDGYGLGTIELVPDGDITSDQYVIIDPTSPNHIHIRAGGNIDESTAELILGGERNKVAVSDLYKSVAITTAEIITNTYANAHEANSEDLIVPEISDILIGDNIVISGINHPVTYFSPDPNNTGFSIVRATGVTFIAGESYTFVRDQGNNNQWTFGDGELSFPNGSSIETEMDAGHLIISTAPSSINNGGNIEINAGYTLGEDKSGGSVSISAGAAGAGSAGGAVYITTTDTGRILLAGDGGEFLGNMNIPSNQIATLGDIGIETDYTVGGGTSGTQPTFTGDPLFAGSYIKTAGNLVHFRVTVEFDNITNFGSGQYYVTLPFPAKYGYKFREGCLHDVSAGRDYEIGGHVFAGSSTLELTSTDTQSGAVFDIPFSSSGPITLNVADHFHISGTYIMQDLP